MMNRLSIDSHKDGSGFTLIEVLIATVMFAIILTALNTVLWASMNLREKMDEKLKERRPQNYSLSIIKRDLLNIVPENGLLNGSLIGENQGAASQRMDYLEFYSSNGIVSENYFWGDVQKVEYYLADYETDHEIIEPTQGKTLVRVVTRNLLATVVETPEEQPLLSNILSLEFNYYDGEEWLQTWDSTTQDPPMPLAIHVRIEFEEELQDENNNYIITDNERIIPPLETIIPIVSVAVEEEEEQESTVEVGGGQTNPEGDQGDSSDPSGQNSGRTGGGQ